MNSRKTKSIFVSFDKWIILISVSLMLFGLVIQMDIGSSRGSEDSLQYFSKQLIWTLISLPFMLFIGRINNLFDFLKKNIAYFLFGVIILLILVLIIGTTAKGGTRWLRFAGVGLQPSMPAAIILILYISKILDKKQLFIARSNLVFFISDFAPIIIFSIVVFGLIFLEKHLSTLIVLGTCILGMLFVSNIKLSTLIILIVGVAGLGLIAVSKGEDYRSSRMEIFSKYSLYHKALNLKVSETKTNDYQVKESLTALSSGRIFGTGFSKGRAKHYFLPDAKSDYVYAIIGEQFGFLGALLLLAVYTFLFYKCCLIAMATETLFTQIAGVGLSLNFYLTAMVNIGVAISALPPTGLTLPFISYGGSSLLINAVNMGLILNLSAKRKVIQ